jgi:hypothetical protein
MLLADDGQEALAPGRCACHGGIGQSATACNRVKKTNSSAVCSGGPAAREYGEPTLWEQETLAASLSFAADTRTRGLLFAEVRLA